MKNFSLEEMECQLRSAFGAVRYTRHETGMSATVQGFVSMGQDNFFLSRGGMNESDALRTLFHEVCSHAASANPGFGKHPTETSHVYNGKKQEVVFSPDIGFVVTPHVYDDRCGF